MTGDVVQPPGRARLVILWLPGGRYPGSAPPASPGLAAPLARRAEAAVVCCRYRATFPSALADVQAEYCRSLALAAGPVVLAGERAGAGLAAALLLRLRDQGAPLPCGAVLISGLLDLTLQAPSLRLNVAVDPAFEAGELRQQAARYAAGTPLADPLLSPLHANLHGLPPLQVLAAGNDLLVDDSLAFAARAARSGVPVDLHVRPDAASLRREAVAVMAAFAGAQAQRQQPRPSPGPPVAESAFAGK